MNKRKIFALDTDQSTNESTLYIYDDIYSGSGIPEAIRKCTSQKIHVRINSYGGEVGEGLAIYNALKESKAEVITYCDSMACSIASVIFMAGTKRIISEYGFILIHNAWSWAQGNANDMRKTADDLEKFTKASVEAYVLATGITEDEIQEMLDNETLLDSDEAVAKGFATEKVLNADEQEQTASQSARKFILQKIKQQGNGIPHQEETALGNFKISLSGDVLNISVINNDSDDNNDETNEKVAEKVAGFLNIIL